LGVLVRDAEVLEVMERVDTLVVDKTGTLTMGRPGVTEVLTASDVDEATLLRLVAGLERASEHPLAAAIVAAAESRGIEPASVAEFESMTGRGVVGTVDGRRVAVGNLRLLAELGSSAGAFEAEADRLRAGGATVVFVAIDGTPA